MQSKRSVLKALIITAIAVILVFDSYRLGQMLWALATTECDLRDSWSAIWKTDEASRLADRFAPQIQLSKTENGLDLWSTPIGAVWTVQGEKTLPYLVAEHHSDVYEPAGHIVRSGDIVLDCGANIGMFTRTAVSRGARLVIAIEPAPRTAAALRRNLEAEIRQGRVVVYEKGVWDREAEMDLSIDEANEGSNSLVIAGGTSKVRVPLTTIDKIVAELKLPRVDFIKMDIEGAEKRALQGAANTIRQFHPRMSLSSEHLEDDFRAIPALVSSIEPRYAARGCDCVVRNRTHIKALVLAFKVKG